MSDKELVRDMNSRLKYTTSVKHRLREYFINVY